MTQNYNLNPEFMALVYNRAKSIIPEREAEDFVQNVLLRTLEYAEKFPETSKIKVLNECFALELAARYYSRIKKLNLQEAHEYYRHLKENADYKATRELLVLGLDKMNDLELLIAKDLLNGLTEREISDKHEVSDFCIKAHIDSIRNHLLNDYILEEEDEH